MQWSHMFTNLARTIILMMLGAVCVLRPGPWWPLACGLAFGLVIGVLDHFCKVKVLVGGKDEMGRRYIPDGRQK